MPGEGIGEKVRAKEKVEKDSSTQQRQKPRARDGCRYKLMVGQ